VKKDDLQVNDFTLKFVVDNDSPEQVKRQLNEIAEINKVAIARLKELRDLLRDYPGLKRGV